jgi:hypothetical protein
LLVTTASTPSDIVGSSAAVSAQQLPTNCHPANKLTVKLLALGSWGLKWNMAVSTWVQFEASYNYKGVSQLSAASCLPEVHQWIKSGRAARCPPGINVAKYQNDFWAWWANVRTTVGQ